MAFFDATAARSSGLSLGLVWTVVSAPFRLVGRGLVAIADASSQMEKVNRLNAMTDEELALAGTTRANEVRRIFAAAGGI